ncbi:MAG: hypothetical protein QOE06_1905 [Thermoleophilaceae bacterium]|jgi:hypothetical protein|nr:hypothetical protein [Thermoleophilaceae bacterium]
MVVRPALVLACCLALVLPGAARGADAALRSLGTSESPALTDGTRYAVFLSDATHLTVRDDARDRSFEVSNLAGCRPVALAEGARLLRECPADPPDTGLRYEVVNLTQETVNDVPVQPGDVFTDIGTRWVAGLSQPGPGELTRTYMDWRTGRRESFGEDPSDARVPRDLDSVGLAAISPPRPAEFAVEADDPFTVAQTGRDGQGRPAYLDLYRGTTTHDLGVREARLERCGATACQSITIGGGLVTWVKGRQVRGRALRGGQRVLVRIAAGASAAGLRATHTRKTVYVALFRGEDESSGYRLYALDWR